MPNTTGKRPGHLTKSNALRLGRYYTPLHAARARHPTAHGLIEPISRSDVDVLGEFMRAERDVAMVLLPKTCPLAYCSCPLRCLDWLSEPSVADLSLCEPSDFVRRLVRYSEVLSTARFCSFRNLDQVNQIANMMTRTTTQ